MYAYEYEIYERVELTAISQTTLYWDIPGDVDRGQPGQQFVIVAVPAGDDDHPEHLEVETLPFTMDESRSSGFSGTSVFVTTPHSAFEPATIPSGDLAGKKSFEFTLAFPIYEANGLQISFDVIDVDEESILRNSATMETIDATSPPEDMTVNPIKSGYTSWLPPFKMCSIRAIGPGGAVLGASPPFFTRRSTAWILSPRSGETLVLKQFYDLKYVLIGGESPPDTYSVRLSNSKAAAVLIDPSSIVANTLISRSFSTLCTTPGGFYELQVGAFPSLWASDLLTDSVQGVGLTQTKLFTIFPRHGSVWKPGKKAQVVYRSSYEACMPTDASVRIEVTWGKSGSALTLADGVTATKGVFNFTVPLGLEDRDDYRIIVTPKMAGMQHAASMSEPFTIYNAPDGEDLSLLLGDIHFQQPIGPSGFPTYAPSVLPGTAGPSSEPEAEEVNTALIVSLSVIGVLLIIGSVMGLRYRNEMCRDPNAFAARDDSDDGEEDGEEDVLHQINPMTAEKPTLR